MAKKRPFRLNDILLNKTIGPVTASPDGRLAVFAVGGADLAANKNTSELWAWSEDRGAWQVTFGGQAALPRFSPRGDRLAFLSDRAGEKKQVFVMAIGLSEGRKVTSFEEGAEDIRWSPDGRRLAVLAKADKTEDEKARDKDKRDWWTADADERRRRLWVVNADGSGKPRQMSADDENVVTVTWAPDGKRLVYNASKLATTDSAWLNSELKIVGADGRGRRTLGPITGSLYDPGMSVSPDGRRLLLCEGFSAADRFHGVTRTIDLSTGKRTPVTRPADFNATSARWLSNDEVCLLTGDRTSIKLCTCRLGGRPRPLATGPGVAAVFDVAPKARKVFYAYTEFGRPDELCRLDLDGGATPQVLTSLNKPVDRIDLPNAEVVRWKAPDGLEIEGILYTPTGTEFRKPYPLVLIPHGGPFGAVTNGYQQGITPSALAAEGIAVLMPNFRGSTGYGRAFVRSIVANWGGGPMNDILAGVDAMVRRGVVNPRKLAIVGGSYGGFLTTYTIGHTDRFRCAVAIAPVTSHVSMFGTTDIPTFMVYCSGGASPGFTHEFWRDQSPTHYASKVRTPTLVVTGEADSRVPPGQSWEFYRLIKHHGVETKLVLYPREPHGIGEPRHKINHVKEIVEWVKSHIRRD
ncbi:MAG: prolyl oligopeptidase family serine peptidase [Phycisphaerae bacterium]